MKSVLLVIFIFFTRALCFKQHTLIDKKMCSSNTFALQSSLNNNKEVIGKSNNKKIHTITSIIIGTIIPFFIDISIDRNSVEKMNSDNDITINFSPRYVLADSTGKV